MEVGAIVEEVYEIFGRENISLVAQFGEGSFSPALEIRLPSATVSPAMVIPFREGWPCPGFRVVGVDVRDPRFRTSEGFGVGSTLSEIRQRYQVKLTQGEEGAYGAYVATLEMSFNFGGPIYRRFQGDRGICEPRPQLGSPAQVPPRGLIRRVPSGLPSLPSVKI